jgi:hypothetical protein
MVIEKGYRTEADGSQMSAPRPDVASFAVKIKIKACRNSDPYRAALLN